MGGVGCGMVLECGVGYIVGVCCRDIITGGRLVQNKGSNLNQSWSKNHTFCILIKAMFVSIMP